MAPMPKASASEPRFAPPVPTDAEKREKSIVKTSNMASARATKTSAIARLNQGEALMVPNVPAVRMTTTPSTP